MVHNDVNIYLELAGYFQESTDAKQWKWILQPMDHLTQYSANHEYDIGFIRWKPLQLSRMLSGKCNIESFKPIRMLFHLNHDNGS